MTDWKWVLLPLINDQGPVAQNLNYSYLMGTLKLIVTTIASVLYSPSNAKKSLIIIINFRPQFYAKGAWDMDSSSYHTQYALEQNHNETDLPSVKQKKKLMYVVK